MLCKREKQIKEFHPYKMAGPGKGLGGEERLNVGLNTKAFIKQFLDFLNRFLFDRFTTFTHVH